MTRSMMLASLVAGAAVAAVALTAAGSAQTPATAQTMPGGKLVTGSTAPGGAVVRPAAKIVKPATVDHAVSALPALNPNFQTVGQLQTAGVKRCLHLAQTIGQATLLGASQYAATSTWNARQPDKRFAVSMIGELFGANPGLPQVVAGNGVSGVFTVPTAEGKCDAAAVQIVPSAETCATLQTQILQGGPSGQTGKVLGNLAGVPLLQNAGKAQVLLVPAANNTCVMVALSTIYTE